MKTGNKEADRLYDLAGEILKENGFYFCHSCWILSDTTEDESPGICVGWKNDYSALSVYAVVETDTYARDCIYISEEATLRGVLSSLVLLIKNWEEKVQKMRDE